MTYDVGETAPDLNDYVLGNLEVSAENAIEKIITEMREAIDSVLEIDPDEETMPVVHSFDVSHATPSSFNLSEDEFKKAILAARQQIQTYVLKGLFGLDIKEDPNRNFIVTPEQRDGVELPPDVTFIKPGVWEKNIDGKRFQLMEILDDTNRVYIHQLTFLPDDHEYSM